MILDMVGGDYINRNSMRCAIDGRMVHIAFLKGTKAEINFATGHGQAPDHHRLDPPPPLAWPRRARSPRRWRRRSGR